MVASRQKPAIRPIKEAELQTLATHLPPYPRNQHNKYFAAQAQGNGCFLICWLNGRAVGHVFLALHPSTEDAVLEAHRQQPFIKDLFVHGEFRQQSIGYELMVAAEERARECHATKIGLGVSVKNLAAQNLYAKLGYEDSQQGEYFETGKFMDSDGLAKDWSEPCLFLLKDLRA